MQNADGSPRRFSAANAEAAARQAFRTFMRSPAGRALAKKKWESFPRKPRTEDTVMGHQRESLTAALGTLVPYTQTRVTDERRKGAAGSNMKMLAREFVRKCQPSFDRAKELRNDPLLLTDEEADRVLEVATNQFWIQFERPLKDVEDARFLFDLYMLVHVRPEAETGGESTTHICAMRRIVKPSLLEFLQGITYKAHLRKIPASVTASLQSGDGTGKTFVKRVRTEMMASHGTAVME